MPDSARLSVRVQPRASKNEVVGFDASGALRIRVTAPPVEGAANKAVIQLLSDALGVPRSRISVVVGKTARVKIVEVQGTDEGEFRRRISAAIGG